MVNFSGIRDRSLVERYRDLRRCVGRLVGSNYDLTNRCNLRCEGCLFFEGDDPLRYRENELAEDWNRFFAAEAARGINWGYFAGAEPALVIDRLRIAHRHIENGVVFTNGTVRIPRDLGYRVHVSLWGDQHHSERVRGADVLSKAIRNYAQDDRAVFVYTISAQNIDQILPTAKLLAGYGATMTFNYYSPTIRYLAKLGTAAPRDDDYFRISTPGDNLVLAEHHLRRASAAIAASLDAFPRTIRYSLDYDRWVTRPGGIYDIDPSSGVARDCGNRLTSHFRHYNADLSVNEQKCCSPNIDCRSCRAYAQSYATFLTRHREFARDESSFRLWLAVWELWAGLFLGDRGSRHQSAAEKPFRDHQVDEASES